MWDPLRLSPQVSETTEKRAHTVRGRGEGSWGEWREVAISSKQFYVSVVGAICSQLNKLGFLEGVA